MELPRCKRCAKKNIVCAYPNSRSSMANTTFPELEFQWLDDLMRDPDMMPWSGSLQPQLDASSQGTLSRRSDSDILSFPREEPDYLLGTPVPTKSTLARAETEAALHRFKTWPEKWVKQGKAPFIHPSLYASSMPKVLQDAYAACAIYSTKTDLNEFVAFTVIEAKANGLLHAADQASWTPLDLLAAVQALLIFQFIRLFDGDIRQRALAEKAEPVLEAWSQQLKARTTKEREYTTETSPSWRSWIFSESVRRTVTMSVFLAGIYSLVKQGFCTLGDQVTANSFTAQRQLWEASGPVEWEQAKLSYNPHWISKMQFDQFLQEGNGNELDDFGLILLITYKGQDVADRWMATTQAERDVVMDRNFHQSLLDMIQDREYGQVSSLEPLL